MPAIVPGRIADEDIARVRELSPIDAIVGDYVQLRSAGGGELKGLCPFHEEKSPSFHVSPARGLFHCFGCGEGGDTIGFVRRIEHLGFAEAVEKLAARAGLELRYEQGGASARGATGVRARLVAAHAAAAAVYAEALADDPAAAPAREFLARRGFDPTVWTTYGLGYAPDSWDALIRRLSAGGFTREELVAGGLAVTGQRGPYDRFRGRLMFPIRDATGEVVGFGARALRDDQQPKYLNTPETPVYRKSQVLYGLDKARVEIGRRAQAVVVEGYTDVMACHLAGVPTAVATCGTSLTADHIAMLRRLLMDQDEFRGEIVFTFDGDAAGRRAALKVFEDDARFVTQTYVAVQPDGLDPCELRLTKGDAAVRDLIARRVPLYEYKIRSELDRFDLDTPEGRVQALATCAPVVAGIRDRALRPEYARRLAGWLGMPESAVVARVGEFVRAGERGRPGGRPTAGTPGAATALGAGATAPGAGATRPGAGATTPGAGAARPGAGATAPGGAATVAAVAAKAAGRVRPRGDDPAYRVEREALKAALQSPAVVGPEWDTLDSALFTAEAYRACAAAIRAAGGVAGVGGDAASVQAYLARVRDAAPDDDVRSLLTELAVEPLYATESARPAYAVSQVARLQEMGVTRRMTELKGRLQRLNPVEQSDEYNQLFAEVIDLQARARALRERALGEPTS